MVSWRYRAALLGFVLLVANRPTRVVGRSLKENETASSGGVGAEPDDRYIVTIDAGSSGSRVHVHKVSAPTAENPIPSIRSAVNKKIKPGLSSFESNPKDAEGHVNGLVDFALDNVPQEAWKDTPIFLKATAGMRSIPEDSANKIMGVVRGVFAATNFMFEPDWADVISGTDEAQFSWIAANYLKGRFTDKDDKPLVGVIEMGGASLQISYPVEAPGKPNDEDYLTINLDKTYHIFAHSFLGYGLDKAQELLAEKAAEEIGFCYPEGYSVEGKISGNGNYAKCYNAMDNLIGRSKCPAHPPNTEHCAIDGKTMPKFNGIKFLAIENFYYTSSFLQTDDHIEALPKKGKFFCARSWEENKAKYSDEEESALQRYCFSSAFITALLEKGFEIPAELLEVARTIGDNDIDWAIGSVIHDIINLDGGLLGGRKKKEKSSASFSAKSMFMLFAPLALLLLAAMYIQRKRKQGKYRPVSQDNAHD